MNDQKKLLEDLEREYSSLVFDEHELQHRLEEAEGRVDKNVRVTGNFLNETLIRVFDLVDKGYRFNPNGGSQVAGGMAVSGFYIAVALQKPAADIASEVAVAQSGVEEAYRQELAESKAKLLDRIAELRVSIEDDERSAAEQEKRAARIAKARATAAKEFGL